MITLFIVATALLGLYMAWNIGANDVANSMADAVGSKACTIKQAVILAGICEFAGAVLVGSHVTQTVRKGIVNPNVLQNLPNVTPEQAAAMLVIGMMSALLAAALWLNVATWMGMPVSTTHSIVGAVSGFGVVAAGWSAVQWNTMGKIVASWFISPVVGGLIGLVCFKMISVLILGRDKPARAASRVTPSLIFFTFFVMVLAVVYKGLKPMEDRISWLTDDRVVALGLEVRQIMPIAIAVGVGVLSAIIGWFILRRKLAEDSRLPLGEQLERVERVFAPLVVTTSCTVAFAHGANDVANAVGPLAAVVETLRQHAIQPAVPVPFWILGLGGLGIVLGLATYGYRVMITVGSKITSITPSRGVAADIAAMATVLTCSKLGLPVSTTHTLVGAILGVALARGVGSVNKQVTRNIFGSWLITVPAAALLAAVLFLIGRVCFLDIIATHMANG